MKLQVGDLVRYIQGPERLGVVTMVHTTVTGADVCEVIIVYDNEHPHTIGEKRYLNQDYWKQVSTPSRPIDKAIEGHEIEYEEAIELHKTYGES